MALISIVTPCYNEEDNVEALYEAVRDVMASETAHTYEHVFIDNASSDGTVQILRQLAAADPNVKLILNARNFGHIRSPYYALLQCHGDAAMIVAADLEDPPEAIPEFIRRWEEGYKITIGVKTGSEEGFIFHAVRSFYYFLIGHLSDTPLVKDFMGFGLYDRELLEILREIDDPYPYLRGLVCEIGFERAIVRYRKPSRKRGFSKNGVYALYDTAMLGFTNHSKVPLRLATWTGFLTAVISLLVALGYFVYKLLFWNEFEVGLAPLVIGMFLLSAVQLMFLGVVGEYVGAVYTQVLHRPLVIERERVNFGDEKPRGA